MQRQLDMELVGEGKGQGQPAAPSCHSPAAVAWQGAAAEVGFYWVGRRQRHASGKASDESSCSLANDGVGGDGDDGDGNDNRDGDDNRGVTAGTGGDGDNDGEGGAACPNCAGQRGRMA
ncbi:hypothetical protein OsI_02383 [Oryza sativa Indica Group]|uniref:Uncharacterized protein n=1 Tax=Oryza sativa subsp. indica TaxID=39946 RepID=B8AA15_ORYSI|nr:hypothetical protein OsI_02383 [Oryza sativa Indica Group]